MITEAATKRASILTFWGKHGDTPTQEAFGIGRATLFRWQTKLTEGGGKLEALNPKSRAPTQKRKRIIPEAVTDFIINERRMEKIGKEKLAILLEEDGIAVLSSSTVGRILGDLKKQGKLPDTVRVHLSGRTGRMIENKPGKKRPKLRSKGHSGELVKADSIVRFTNGIKRYVVTSLECGNKFAFAYGYTSHASTKTADFMKMFQHVAPFDVTHIQTDNGSEFADHFDLLLNEQGIAHFHTYPRCPKMNAEIERFNRTLSEAFIAPNRYLLAYNLPEFNKRLMEWLLWYNTRRPHWSLGLVSPLKYICNQLPAPESHMWWTST
ncbi:MAG: transposase [Candidatus Andersenbacteria bacterium]|nr:transposase [Candidatus Andersenbacteria bacterium]